VKRITRDCFKFDCTGRKFYANLGTIGLDPDEAKTPHEGYDGSLHETLGEISSAEREELAWRMIQAWAEYGGVQFAALR
jgi:hypothetical protein